MTDRQEEGSALHMSARAALSAVLIAAAVAASSPARAHGGPWLPAPGQYYTEIRGGLSSADDFHDLLSHRRTLARGGVSEQRSLLSYSEIGWKQNVSLVFGLPALSVTRRSGNGRLDRTVTGLADLQLGLRFKLAEGRTAFAFEVDYGAPLGYLHSAQLDTSQLRIADQTTCRGLTDGDSANCIRQQSPPVLGLGQQEVTAALHWGAELRRVNGFIQLTHGYRHRGREVAGQALFGADLGFWFFPRLLVAGRYLGAIEVGSGTTRADEIEEHLAGPVVIYRPDDRIDIFAASLHTAIARNALHADRYYVGVSLKKTGLNRLQGYLGGTKRP